MRESYFYTYTIKSKINPLNLRYVVVGAGLNGDVIYLVTKDLKAALTTAEDLNRVLKRPPAANDPFY